MSWGVNVREVEVLTVSCDSCCDGGPAGLLTSVDEAHAVAETHYRAHVGAYADGEGVTCIASTHRAPCPEFMPL